MKKLLISIGTILIMACVVVLFGNAEGSKKESRKAKTEVKKETVAAPACCQSVTDKTTAGDPAKCKEMESGDKDGKCDPAVCTSHKEDSRKEAKACNPAAPCAATCGSKATDVK